MQSPPESTTAWDWRDWLAVAGTVVAAIGFVAAFIPGQVGGALFPVGLAMMTTAAYAGRENG